MELLHLGAWLALTLAIQTSITMRNARFPQ